MMPLQLGRGHFQTVFNLELFGQKENVQSFRAADYCRRD
jgi:hypothetical protein